jgi:3-dehydroquinate synthase class II
MDKVYKTDWYYIRSGDDWKVIPIGEFTDDDEGRDEAIEVANADAEKVGETALLYLHVDALLDLQDELERAFKETHKDFIDAEE